MKTYKIKSSAVRAAKKEMGDNWMDFASIIQVGEEFAIELKATSSIKSTVEAVQLLADNDKEVAEKAAKKAEIEKKKPAFIPAKPAHEAVAEEIAPKSKPSLPPFLKKPVIEESAVPEEAKLGDAVANLASVNVDPLRPRLSSCELPTKKVWHIADSMPGAKRKDVIEECVRQGIAYGTARTQYQHWFKTLNDSKAAPIAVIGKDGKVSIPGKE